MSLPLECEIESMREGTFRTHLVPQAALIEQVHRALLEHARTNGRLNLGARPRLNDDRIDSIQVQEV